jgi:GT2 family glycosyltransferase
VSPALSVVVPNFNGAAVLPRCLAALRAQTLQPAEVVVVDNGSTDGSADEAERSGARVLRLGRNTGFGAAANAGVDLVTSELVCVLNSDARPVAGWAEQVVGFAAHAPARAWSWGGPLVTPAGDLESAGDCYSPEGFAYKQGKGDPVEQLPTVPYEVFAPPGAAPVFRRSVFLDLGGYDARYFLYLEDIDLAFRARSRGHSSWVVPQALVEHDLGGSGTSAVAAWHIGRNAVWCQVTHAPSLNPRLVWATTARELSAHRAVGTSGPFLRGRLAAAWSLPRLMRQRRVERRSRVISDAELLVACGLPLRVE